jgi:hypothetical protein
MLAAARQWHAGTAAGPPAPGPVAAAGGIGMTIPASGATGRIAPLASLTGGVARYGLRDMHPEAKQC